MQKWKVIFIFFVILFSFYSLYPSYRFYGMEAGERSQLSSEQRSNYLQSIVKLGLDLQGGMHLVLEVDDSELSEGNSRSIRCKQPYGIACHTG